MAITKIAYSNHEEWLAIRKQYIGGSEAAAVVGMNTYKSAYALWAEKTGKVAPFEGNLTTEVGAYLEEFVAQLFTRETGIKVRKCNFTMVNDLYPFACANVDRLVVGEKALLEIKTTNSLPRMRKVRGGEFPDEWYCQMVHYLAVTGLERAYLAVLVNGREFYMFTLERDQDEINSLMTAEADFWKHVAMGEAPAVDGNASTGDALNEMYPGGDDGEADLTFYRSELADYIEIGKQIKELKKLQDTAANKVKVFMADTERGSCEGFAVSWKNQTRSSFDADGFRAAHPEININEFYKTTSSRTFRITEKKVG